MTSSVHSDQSTAYKALFSHGICNFAGFICSSDAFLPFRQRSLFRPVSEQQWLKNLCHSSLKPYLMTFMSTRDFLPLTVNVEINLLINFIIKIPVTEVIDKTVFFASPHFLYRIWYRAAGRTHRTWEGQHGTTGLRFNWPGCWWHSLQEEITDVCMRTCVCACLCSCYSVFMNTKCSY